MQLQQRVLVAGGDRLERLELRALGVEARREPGRIGLWVGHGADNTLIAAPAA